MDIGGSTPKPATCRPSAARHAWGDRRHAHRFPGVPAPPRRQTDRIQPVRTGEQKCICGRGRASRRVSPARRQSRVTCFGVWLHPASGRSILARCPRHSHARGTTAGPPHGRGDCEDSFPIHARSAVVSVTNCFSHLLSRLFQTDDLYRDHCDMYRHEYKAMSPCVNDSRIYRIYMFSFT